METMTDWNTLANEARDVPKEMSPEERFAVAFPEEYAWIRTSTFDFAVAMQQVVRQYGRLTDRQMAAVRKCMAYKPRQSVAKVAVEGEGYQAMVRAFAAAKASGLRRPGLSVGNLRFSLAGEASRNAGAIYVKSPEHTYLGKIMQDGGFWPSAACMASESARIVEVCKDPLGAAVAHGQKTGRCSCCGLLLTNAESVRLGIGPICRAKWGWA